MTSRRLSTALRAALAFGLLATAACRDGAHDEEDPARARIDFAGSTPAYETLEIDSGLLEVAEGVQMRTVTTFQTFWEVEASGTAYTDWIMPIADTGSISLRGEATIDVYATVTIPGQEFDGLVGTRTADLGVGVSEFDPFLLDEPWLLGFDMPNEIEVRVEPASGIGLAFVVEMSLSLLPTYEGLCLGVDEDADAAQYTVVIQPMADFKYLYSVETVTPISNTRLGSVGFDFEWDELDEDFGLEIDLGAYSMEDGERVEDSRPCG